MFSEQIQKDNWPLEDSSYGLGEVEQLLLTKNLHSPALPQLAELIQRVNFVNYPMNNHSERIFEWLSAKASEYLGRLKGGIIYDHASCDKSAMQNLASDVGAQAYVGTDVQHVKTCYRVGHGGPHRIFIRGDALDIASRMRANIVSLVTLSGLDGGEYLGAQILSESPKLQQKQEGKRCLPFQDETRNRIAAILGAEGDLSTSSAKPDTSEATERTPEEIHRSYLQELVRCSMSMLLENGLFVVGHNALADQTVLVDAARQFGLREVRIPGDSQQEIALFEKM